MDPNATLKPITIDRRGGVDVFCDWVYVVDRPNGSFPRTLEWIIVLDGGVRVPIEWAQMAISGPDGMLVERLEAPDDEELNFNFGLGDDGVVVGTQFLVKFEGYEVAHLTKRVAYVHEGDVIRTNPKHSYTSGGYTQVETSCPG